VWLDRAGYPEICAYSLCDDHNFRPERLEVKRQLIPILTEAIDHLNPLPPGSLVVVDPLGLFMGGNLNDYYACAVSMLRIRRLCQTRQITILGLAHAGKQKGDSRQQYRRLQDRIAGSTGQHGFGDTQMYLASPEETGDKWYTFLWHPHTAPAEEFKLGRDPATGLFIPWQTAVMQEHAKPLVDAAQRLLDHIPTDGDGMSFAELIEWAETERIASRKSIYRYLLELVDQGHVQKVSHGRYRKLPPS
jgi:hypothetical protein